MMKFLILHPHDEEIFDFGMLRFQGSGTSASLKVTLGPGLENSEETWDKTDKEDEWMIVKELSFLRNKKFSVNLEIEKESQTLGKIEYKRNWYIKLTQRII